MSDQAPTTILDIPRRELALEAIERDLARKNLLAFMRYCWQDMRDPFVFGRHTVEMCRAIDMGVLDLMQGRSTYLDFRVPFNHGKALHVDTPIPTPGGFVRIADLKAGDTVFDERGRQQRVVAVSQVWKDRAMFAVYASDRDSTVAADGRHEWVVRSGCETQWETVDTRALYRRMERGECFYVHNDRRIFVNPICRGDTMCIEVSGASHQYLCGRGMLPTHNSQISSRYGPAYCLGRLAQVMEPDVIIASHSADMSAGFSRYVQDIIESPQYSVLFPSVRVSRKLRSATKWGLEGRRNEVNAVGIGTGTHGMRGNLIILDDYFGNYQDSMSSAMQDAAWNMLRNDLFSRMGKVCLFLIVATPWNLQGVQARAEEEEKRNDKFPKFKRVRYRARWKAQDGSDRWEYLFPERLSASWYEDQYGVLLPFEIAGKLDCDPVPLAGNIASRAWFPAVERGECPSAVRRARWWDTAATKKKGSDQTVGLRGFMGASDGILYLDDAVVERLGAPEIPGIIRAIAGQDGGMTEVILEREPGSQGPIACAMMVQMLGGYPVIVALTGGKAKLVRSMPMLTAAKHGKVRVIRGSWNEAFWRQVDTFTGGEGNGHDDFIDAAGGLWRHFAGTLECDSVIGGSVKCTY